MDELTKKAIEETKNKRGVKEVKEISKETKEIKAQEAQDTKNQVILGKNKKVTIKPWTGKTKKKVRKFFEFAESPEEIDFKEVIKTLIYDYVNEDIYLNDDEQQYILSKIKDISLSDDIDALTYCPICSAENTFKTRSDLFLHYKENELPFKYNEEIEFVDIISLKDFDSEVKNIMESEDYDGITTEKDIETAMFIKIKDKNTEQVIEYLDDLPLNKTQEIIKVLNEKLPKTEMYINRRCTSCNTEVDFTIDITKPIFESLLK